MWLSVAGSRFGGAVTNDFCRASIQCLLRIYAILFCEHRNRSFARLTLHFAFGSRARFESNTSQIYLDVVPVSVLCISLQSTFELELPFFLFLILFVFSLLLGSLSLSLPLSIFHLSFLVLFVELLR